MRCEDTPFAAESFAEHIDDYRSESLLSLLHLLRSGIGTFRTLAVLRDYGCN
jgi:hypothetical protein